MNGRTMKILGASCVVLCASAAWADDLPKYTVQFLVPTVMVTDLGDGGTPMGQSFHDGGVVSWVWTAEGGQQFLTGLPGMQYARGFDVNAAGVVVGMVTGGSGTLPAMWTPVDGVYGEAVLLPMLPGATLGRARAINDVGDIVGTSGNVLTERATLFTAPGGPVDLDALGFTATPSGVSNTRLACGDQLIFNLNTYEVIDVGVPDSPPSYLWTVLTDINDDGAASAWGQIATSLPDDRHVLRYTPGEGWLQLSSVPAPYWTGTSINRFGDVGFGYRHLVHFDSQGAHSPSGLLAPGYADWTISTGYAVDHVVLVNDRRQLLLRASNAATGESGAVLLTPTKYSGDLNGDGVVDGSDLLLLLGGWGPCPGSSQWCAADINDDGTVDGSDLLLLLANWG
jgi:hypothetical protein